MFFNKNKNKENDETDMVDIEELFISAQEDDEDEEIELEAKEVKIEKKTKVENVQKNKKNNNGDFVKMEDVDSSDFMIVGHEQNQFLYYLKSFFKVLISIILLAILGILIFAVVKYKVIPENIKGEEYRFDNFHIVSRNYQPNIEELKKGDKVICLSEDQLDWSPYIYSYYILEVKSRNGYIIYCKDAEGKDVSIQSVDISYILTVEENGNE